MPPPADLPAPERRAALAEPDPPLVVPPRRPWLGVLVTLAATALAIGLGWWMWTLYALAPWTRDGTVRVNVVTIAPEIAGEIVALPVADNQFVHKGDLLMVIDPTDYRIAVRLREAAVQQAKVTADNATRQAQRRLALPDIAVSPEQQQTFTSQAVSAQAQYQAALANLDQARVNLARTEIRSPVNGWVTNLLAQRGNYANAGQNQLAVVDADSFWVDAYFEETRLGRIHPGDPARIKLMGYGRVIPGHVQSIARAISVANAIPNAQGVATVNPIFTWVRLAQRIPVRITFDRVPADVTLAAGMTATVEVEPGS